MYMLAENNLGKCKAIVVNRCFSSANLYLCGDGITLRSYEHQGHWFHGDFALAKWFGW